MRGYKKFGKVDLFLSDGTLKKVTLYQHLYFKFYLVRYQKLYRKVQFSDRGWTLKKGE